MPALLFSALAAGQNLPTAQPSLNDLNQSSGVIFSGTVTQIELLNTPDAKPAIVRVKFRVDQAVRGCIAGEAVILDEWAELWVRGDRYRKGQRALIFLYPPSGTGFSSPVAGDVGTIRIGPDGLLRTTPQQASLLASHAASSQPDAGPTQSESDTRTHTGLRNRRELRNVARTQEDAE
jgi:hypothetical protein